MDGRVALLWLTILGVLSICKGHQYSNGNLEFNDNLKLGWRINSTKGTIRFTVKLTGIGEKGWFLIGLVPQMNNSKKLSLKDISGDGFVVWKGASTKKEHKGPIWRITHINVNKGTLSEVHQADIHLGSSVYDKKTKTLTAIIWRPLKTKSGIEIKQGQFVVFGSYGNEDGSKIKKWKNKLKHLVKIGAVEDAFTTVEHVNLLIKTPETEKTNDKKGFAYAAGIAEKHWIGVVIGISAFLTVLITCSVYCFTKKKKNEFKRVVSMPFHKNGDDEDEAKVAFLQSEET